MHFVWPLHVGGFLGLFWFGESDYFSESPCPHYVINYSFQDENDKLRAALKFLQSQHPSDGADLESSSLNDSSVDLYESSEVNMDESAGFDNVLNESRGSELMESLHKVRVCAYNIVYVIPYLSH